MKRNREPSSNAGVLFHVAGAFQRLASLILTQESHSTLRAAQPPTDGSSPISELPAEVFAHILSFLPLQKHLQIRKVNQDWQNAWNAELTNQMNPIGLSRGIQQAISSKEGFDLLWESQNKEIELFLKNKNIVLEKTNNDKTVIALYKELNIVFQNQMSPFALHAREEILNKINEAIITARIEQSKLLNDKRLYCVNCCLTRFPACVFEKDSEFWQELQWLFVDNNYLKSLPENIGLCVELQGFHVNNNQLSSLPESINQCTALQIFSAYHNQLSKIPEGLGQCVALQGLDVSNNLLSTVPESISGCVVLQRLDIEDNQLITLPENIGECAALQMLLINKNYLSSLPESLSEAIYYNSELEHISKSQALDSQKTKATSTDEFLQEMTQSIKRLQLR